MKGFVEIELKNTKTGEKKIVKGENMFTNALDSLFNGCPYGLDKCQMAATGSPIQMSGGANSSSVTPLHSKGLGGILLFDTFKTGSSVDDFFEPISHEPTATASVSNPTTDNSKVGVFVESDSGEVTDETTGKKGYKWTYEWLEGNGNGVIGAVALSHVKCWAYHSNYNYKSGFEHYKWEQPGGYQANSRPDFLDYGKGNCYGMLTHNGYTYDLDGRNAPNVVYRAKINHGLGNYGVSLFSSNAGNSILVEDDVTYTHTGTQKYPAISIDDDYFYFIETTGSTDIIINLFRHDINTGEYIDTLTYEATTPKAIMLTTSKNTTSDAQNSPWNPILLYNGYFYIISNDTTEVYKINITDTTDVKVLTLPVPLSTGTSYARQYFILPENSLYGLRVSGKSMEGTSYITPDDYVFHPNDVFTGGHSVELNGVWETYYAKYTVYENYLTPYLATKFTLPEPLEKDNTQTMRITYTVWED